MKYRLPDGREITLRHHSPPEWGEVVRKALLALGCSERYAMNEAIRISGAKKASE